MRTKICIPIICAGPPLRPTLVGIGGTERAPAQPEPSWAWLARAPFVTWFTNGMRVCDQPTDAKLMWFIGMILKTYRSDARAAEER